MTSLQIFWLFFTTAFGSLIALLRKGGKWNPMPSTDSLTDIKLEPPQKAQNSPVEVVTPKSVPVSPKSPTVADLALGLKEFEGWVLPGGKDYLGNTLVNGSNSYQCNNPGNCRYSTNGYAKMYGPVIKTPNNFAKFKDVATGWLYLNNLLKSIIHQHPNLTLLTFIGGDGESWSGYSPASDHNPVTEYAQFLAKRLGVNSDWQLKNLM